MGGTTMSESSNSAPSMGLVGGGIVSDSNNTNALIPLEELQHDLEVNLGRANGNIYHRRPGIEGVHDGQVMVRLKKKRFVVLEYGIEPTCHDLEEARECPNIKILDGAGKRKCTMSNCSKIGVPVCIWDSEPNEVDSLYLRSGMCFTCQRNLNEKRRTERKRKGFDRMAPTVSELGGSGGGAGSASCVVYAVVPDSKRFKLHDGSFIQLSSDSIIISGTSNLLEGNRERSGSWALQDLSSDLQTWARQASTDVDRLLESVSGNAEEAVAVAVQAVEDQARVDAINSEEGEEPKMVGVMGSEVAASSAPAGDYDAAAAAAAVAATGDASPPIHALYDKAFQSLSKAMYLLHEWKTSWDTAVETVTDPNFADAVASAAAVVAAAGGADAASDQGNNMVSLLLAADDQRKDDDGSQHDATEMPTTVTDAVEV